MRNKPPAAFTHKPTGGTTEHQFDPLQLCIYTTIGILAWLTTPALVVAAFGTIGVVAYTRARRRGLAKSRCKLGDTRLVIAYLTIAAVVGITATALKIVELVT
jgi:hypothetical protein